MLFIFMCLYHRQQHMLCPRNAITSGWRVENVAASPDGL